MKDDLESSLKRDKRINAISKWGGRVLIGVALADVIQSLFTGKTVTEYIHPHVNTFQAYGPDFIAFIGGISTGYRVRIAEDAINRHEQELNSPLGILLRLYKQYHKSDNPK